ncbi:MAG TPA: MmcQ/YjbR family DNA-binding protein [Rhizomicrobium sp.]|jgi:predicted DNA-binding protein (MmcQ/YjbR family)|nr:MmcQ/YjbR family DNA-binding protein [Rhizomicrobium sp.]
MASSKTKTAAQRGAAFDRRIAAVKACIEAMPGATGSSLPSAKGVVLYKVVGKMFAIFEVNRFAGMILKCDPHLAEILRGKYEGIGHRSHLDRRHWIAVNFEADVPTKEIERLIAHSYEQVCATLTRKQRAELEAAS